MILLFFGPSGSGKDTQAEILNQKRGFFRVSTGDLIREISYGENEVQKILRESMNEGFLADNFVFGLLQIYLSKIDKNDIILSGAVRRLSQVELLDFTLFKINKKLDKVVYFNLSDEEAIKRMTSRLRCPVDQTNYNTIYNPPKVEGRCDLCGSVLTRREDDNEASIRKRLEDFHSDNDEIIEMYRKRDILLEIDALQSIEDVAIELSKKLGIE